MKIQCPNCSYTREMPEDRIPAGMVNARCPKCGQSFPLFPSPDVRPDREEDVPPGAVAHEPIRDSSARPEREGYRGEPGEERRDQPREEAGRRPDGTADGHGSGAEYRQGPEEDGKEADGGEEEGWSFNPWECARSLQDYPAALYQTCLRVMFAAPRFFAGIRPGPALRAMVFFLVICCLQTVIEHVWGLFFFNNLMPAEGMADPELQQLATLMQTRSSLFSWLLLRCGMLTLQLYIFAGILFLCWRLLAGRQVQFSVILQVLFYAEAPLVLSIIPGVGSIIGMIWSLVCVVLGCRAALRLSWGKTVAGMAPLLFLLILSYMQFLSILGG